METWRSGCNTKVSNLFWHISHLSQHMAMIRLLRKNHPQYITFTVQAKENHDVRV